MKATLYTYVTQAIEGNFSSSLHFVSRNIFTVFHNSILVAVTLHLTLDTSGFVLLAVKFQEYLLKLTSTLVLRFFS